MVKNNKSHLLTEILTARVSQDRKDELQHLSKLKELSGEKVSVSALVNEAIEQYIFTSLKAAQVPLENKELDDRDNHNDNPTDKKINVAPAKTRGKSYD